MKTKIVYSVVSAPNDTYLEQTFLSMYSLRKHNPDAQIVLVVDSGTNETLIGSRESIKNIANKIVSIEVPGRFNSNMLRSRYLKTNLRHFIDGDMLFIDSDTVICRSLEEADNLTCELGMVPDLNGELALTDNTIIARCKAAGFGDQKGNPYFNSGVIFAKDTPSVKQFYNDWFHNWEQSSHNGIHFDQPALCATNSAHNGLISEINGIWNCQYKMDGYPYLKNARIMHYYSNNGNNGNFFSLPLDMLLLRVKKLGEIDPVVGNLLENPTQDFYAVTIVTEQQWMEYNFSHQLFLSTNRPSLFGKLKKLGCWMEKLLYK